MTREQHEAALTANVKRLQGLASAARKPMPEALFHDTAIIEYGGITLVCGGEYSAPCDQWAGSFDVCSVRVEDSATDIFDLLSATQLTTIADRCYWSIRNDTFALMDATR